MAEKKKKPSSKDLLELQSLYQALESDVGISKVDEQLLQKFEQGELSKTEADKLRGELNQAMTSRTSPIPKAEPLALPAPGMQDTAPVPSSRALTTTPEKGILPSALTPEIVSPRARAALPPAQPGVIDATIIPEVKAGALVPVEKGGALAVQNLEQVAAKNPVLKRIMLPALALTGGAAALYGMDSDKKLDVVPSTPTPEPTPAPGPAPAPAVPSAPKAEEPKIIKAKSIDFNKLQKSLEQFNTQYEQDRKLAPEVEQAFATRQTALQSALTDAKSAFEKSLAQAKTEADRRDTITQWASIAESLGHAMVKYFAASTGARTGQLLGSRLQLQKYDWQKDLDRSLEKLKADTAEAKTMFGITKEDVEAQAKQLGEERKTALGEREDIARQRAKTSEALLMEKARAGQRAEEDYASAYNRFLMEQAQEQQRAGREAVKETKELGKQETEKQKTFARLSGALASLEKKDTPQARKQLEEAATLLEIPPEEIDELVKETTGEGVFNMAEPSKVQAILSKYRPGAGAAPAATGMVDMVAPDGRELSVPASRVAEMEAKGARRK